MRHESSFSNYNNYTKKVTKKFKIIRPMKKINIYKCTTQKIMLQFTITIILDG